MKKTIFLVALCALLMNLIFIVSGFAENKDSISLRDKFEEEYQAFVQAHKAFDSMRSTIGPESAKHLENIAKLGSPVLPLIYEKMNKEESPYSKYLSLPFYRITKKHFDKSEWPKEENSAEKVIVQWYSSGRKQTSQKFEQLVGEWKAFKGQAKVKESNEKFQKIKDLGIDALPYLIEKIKHGDEDLVPVVSYLTDGAVKANASSADCLNWWNENKDKWIIPE